MPLINKQNRPEIEEWFYNGDYTDVREFLRIEYPEIWTDKHTGSDKTYFANLNAQKKRMMDENARVAVMQKLWETAQETFKRAMMATMAEINNNIIIEASDDGKDGVIKGVKNIAIFRSCLDELRVFTKQPRYYSPVEAEDPTGDVIKNPLEGVEIILTHDPKALLDNTDVIDAGETDDNE